MVKVRYGQSLKTGERSQGTNVNVNLYSTLSYSACNALISDEGFDGSV